jgi:hypothetical protein
MHGTGDKITVRAVNIGEFLTQPATNLIPYNFRAVCNIKRSRKKVYLYTTCFFLSINVE